MSVHDLALPDAIAAFLDASILLEQIVPGSVVSDLEGLRHIHYGRPRAGVNEEVIADDRDPLEILAVLSRHSEITPLYLSSFPPLTSEQQTVYMAAGYLRFVRNTLMTCRLSQDESQPDANLKRLTDPADLRRLAQIRGDNVLDVDHFTDAVRCYVLDLDGEPVSSALLVPSTHDTALVEYVHTHEAYRRRGYGRWLMRAMHVEAAGLGLGWAVLGANDAGRPLYIALGYVERCYHDIYVVGS